MTTVHYQLTAQEVTRGLVQHRQRSRRIFWARLALLACGLLLFYLHFHGLPDTSDGYYFAGLLFVTIPVAAWLLSPLLIRRAYAKAVRANPVFTDPKEVTFDDKGIVFVSPDRRSELAWNAFVKITQDEQYFYLHGDRLGNVALLPKRAFDAASTEEFLRCTRFPAHP